LILFFIIIFTDTFIQSGSRKNAGLCRQYPTAETSISRISDFLTLHAVYAPQQFRRVNMNVIYIFAGSHRKRTIAHRPLVSSVYQEQLI
jgi:hypothetical protein